MVFLVWFIIWELHIHIQYVLIKTHSLFPDQFFPHIPSAFLSPFHVLFFKPADSAQRCQHMCMGPVPLQEHGSLARSALHLCRKLTFSFSGSHQLLIACQPGVGLRGPPIRAEDLPAFILCRAFIMQPQPLWICVLDKPATSGKHCVPAILHRLCHFQSLPFFFCDSAWDLWSGGVRKISKSRAEQCMVSYALHTDQLWVWINFC